MLPFFRKIRYRLAKDNQFLKYSRYAIGEIILVVLGILIALQVNNWNERQKQKEKEIVNFIALKNDLESDLNSEFIPAIKRYDELTKYSSAAIKFYFDEKNIPIDSLLACLYFSTHEWRFSFHMGAYETLKSGGLDLITNDSIRYKISSLYSDRYPELMLRDKVVQNYNDNHYSPLVFSQIKFNDSLPMQNDFVKYSIPISNYIHVLHYKRVWLLKHVETMKKEVEILIRDLDEELDNLMNERIKKY